MADNTKNTQFSIIKDDPWLAPYREAITSRYNAVQKHLTSIKDQYKSLSNYANRHQELGLNWDKKKNGWTYREWCPNATKLVLVGDFNQWNGESHPLEKGTNGIWEVFISGNDIKHLSKVKVRITSPNETRDRLPAYIRTTEQNTETYDFSGLIWNPTDKFRWTDKKFDINDLRQLTIYECHPGMATEKEGVGTFREFADDILPRIKSLGYNCIQMMSVMEHPYYGSFGYHVSNFFAPSSRYGSPDDLKYLVNKAHKAGIAIIMDMVHSHAVKNIAEGLNDFDGSGHQYFHESDRGYHKGWDSKLFDYGKPEVERFLLSNLRYWLEEFHFDGFRFDGVTSMLYHHHGDHISFDHYDKYFKEGVDKDAVRYLQLANLLIQEVKPGAISIAEDMSGMPGICRKVEDGGIGFDYRLGMGIPDFWIKLLKHSRDEDWDMHEIWSVLVNRRQHEKTVAYAESHDQALVGDKSLAFWLMDKEMYWHMQKDDNHIVIERGIALHKMIRLITASMGGEAYLNFIGNEFGHPEWVDFPREGNEWSYKYARRQWQLVDNPELKYQYLNEFDKAMIQCLSVNEVMSANMALQLNIDETNKVIVFERNNLIFVFNFSGSNSVVDYAFKVPEAGKYKVILNSDSLNFGGHGRVNEAMDYFTAETEGQHQLRVYSTTRTALVLKRIIE